MCSMFHDNSGHLEPLWLQTSNNKSTKVTEHYIDWMDLKGSEGQEVKSEKGRDFARAAKENSSVLSFSEWG